MLKLWTDRGWGDYLYWQTHDKAALKRINQLIRILNGVGMKALGSQTLCLEIYLVGGRAA
jgi:toxin YoeB